MNSLNHRAFCGVAAAMFLGAGTAAVQAAPIFIDFGAISPAVGTEKGPASVSGTWQNPWGAATNPSVADVVLSGGETARLVRGDNTNAVSLTWGANGSPNAANTLTPPVGSIMATEPSVYSDFVRSGDNGRELGFRLSGLTPGTYNVYLVINDASTEAGSRAAIGVLEAEAGNGPHLVDDLAQSVTAPLVDADRALAEWTAWTAGSTYNYIKATVTLDETTDYIVAFLESARGAGSTGNMGIHSLQVVEVPEPASLALIGLGGLAAMRRRR